VPKYYLLFSLLFLFGCQKSKESVEVSEPQLFSLLSPEQTQVNFQNNIQEGLNTNVLMYEYFYNGGGVATGDLNGDGKEDMYFSSNMEANHLYINEGNIKFKEVALQAGVTGRPGPWKTGVSFVDINGDNKLDIYLCYSGNLPPEKKRNQLFINQGNDASGIPTFKDEAALYGLDSPSNSTHAVFFDYDRDQDLDMILVNHNPKSLPVLDESSTADLLSKPDENSGIQFFVNPGKGGKFINQTKALGIQSSILSYGLAVGISDVNQDGWPDFYVSNDYTIPDFLYVNKAGKSFTNTINSSIGHMSHFSMGNDIADVNNDLMPDIFTLDMLPEDNLRQKLLMSPDNYEKYDFNLKVGFGNQIMRNMLQLNLGQNASGNTMFSEVGQLAGISNTDWSWSALFADYDNDGWKDLFVSNGYLRDYTNLDFLKYMGDYVQNNQNSIQRENVLELVQKMPASNVSNYIFKNKKDATFKNVTADWGLEIPTNSNGAAYADLDGDGDLELIVNNINKPASIYENKSNEVYQENKSISIDLHGLGENTKGAGASVSVFQNGQAQVVYANMYRGYQSSMSPRLHVGLGNTPKIDSVKVLWNSGKSQTLKGIKEVKNISFFEKDAKLIQTKELENKSYFVRAEPLIQNPGANPVNDFKRQTQLVNPLSFVGPVLKSSDVNQDGLSDIFVGASQGKPAHLFLQQKGGQFKSVGLSGSEGFEDSDALFVDVDADGDVDLYVASGGYANLEPTSTYLQDRIYLNDGKGNFSISKNKLPYPNGSHSCVTRIDLNADKLPDLFVGARVIPGQYPQVPQSQLLLNQGNGKFLDVSKNYPEIESVGMVTDAEFKDLNEDQKSELIIIGEFMPLQIFNFDKGKSINVTKTFFDESPSGLWNTLMIEDLNKDGKFELLVGNQGLNSQYKASIAEPMELYVKDFDSNGSVEPILTTYVKGIKVPFLTRDELLEQISMMRPRFTDYQSFAEAKLSDIFTEDELKDAKIYQATELKTSLFCLNAGGKYESKPLPSIVQSSPIFAVQMADENADGHLDIVMAGNINHAKLRIGKMDSNYGLLLLGDGQLNFKLVPQKKTGFWLKGDVRSMLKVKDHWYFGINSVGVESYKMLK
jgi:hypothetical protein